MHYIGVRDGKRKIEGKINVSIIVFFTQYASRLCRCIQNLNNLALIGAEKYVTKNIEEKKMDK